MTSDMLQVFPQAKNPVAEKQQLFFGVQKTWYIKYFDV